MCIDFIDRTHHKHLYAKRFSNRLTHTHDTLKKKKTKKYVSHSIGMRIERIDTRQSNQSENGCTTKKYCHRNYVSVEITSFHFYSLLLFNLCARFSFAPSFA